MLKNSCKVSKNHTLKIRFVPKTAHFILLLASFVYSNNQGYAHPSPKCAASQYVLFINYHSFSIFSTLFLYPDINDNIHILTFFSPKNMFFSKYSSKKQKNKKKCFNFNELFISL